MSFGVEYSIFRMEFVLLQSGPGVFQCPLLYSTGGLCGQVS